jgi:hypothetical protein
MLGAVSIHHRADAGRRVDPDPTLVRPRRTPWGSIGIGDDDRTITVGFGRGVYERLRAIETTFGDEEIDVAVMLGITPELAAEMARGPMLFTMQLIVEHTVITLSEPVRGRRFGNTAHLESRGQP